MIRTRKTEPLTWIVGHAPDRKSVPERFVPATVPGAVQLDMARAEGYPDYNRADNYRRMTWMEDRFFTYRAEFDAPGLGQDRQLWFVSKGIDYRYEIRLNDTLLLAREGMFAPVEIDLTPHLHPRNRLEILLFPVPKRAGMPDDRTQASASVKPAVGYGWDWHPRLVPLGIWDETGLQIRRRSHLREVDVVYTLDDDLSGADLRIESRGTECGECRGVWELFDDRGRCAARAEGAVGQPLAARLENPRLWWTHDHGEPALYTSRYTLRDAAGCDLECVEERIGFRRIRLVMNEGAWSEPAGFPKTRSAAPAQVELNGRRIFAKGSNWVCPELFPGTVDAARYETLIGIAAETHFNMLRSWGGGIVNKDAFFECCDRRGIMVWQEFPLSCNCYPDDPEYLAVLEREAAAIIRRLRRHPSLAVWCGGNELFNNWSGMTDQSLPLRLLNALCYRLSPEIPFNATSPLNGMAHGHYLFRWQGKDVFRMMNGSRFTAYTEFGIPGISPREVLEGIIPAEELFPPRPGTAWEEHHAFGAWDGDPSTWLGLPTLARYFPPAETLDELIAQSSLLQGEGYKAVFEEARRQKPYCSMALNWCFDEPWPAAANNSLVAYPAVLKPAIAEVRRACRPLCASARFARFDWKEDETFEAEVWILNDVFARTGPFVVTVTLRAGRAEERILRWESPSVEPNHNTAGPTARFRLPAWDTDRFGVELSVEGHPEMNACYTLMYRRSPRKRRCTSMNVTE
ncbi:glycoside hydrolase family 2 protein [Alistipes dispar]|uniref:glycoside hydrolase family 2 protein n=1 Tax=Alistipes dispar TaxID=2585119 RepID=UPI003BF12541